MLSRAVAADRAPDGGERGAVLVLFSAVLAVLLVLSALVVDLGYGFQLRRRAQGAADAAALAAAQDLPNIASALTTAKDYAARNMGITETQWSGCVDVEALPLRPEPSNSCISFSDSRREVRVRLPETTSPTFFGGIVGRSSLAVSAVAVAGISNAGAGQIIPAAVSGLVGTGLLCLEQAGANQPCSSRERGQFGSLNSPRLALFRPSSNVNQLSLATNYAMGVDHDLVSYVNGVAICDGTAITPCTATNVGTSLVANHVTSTTGNDVPPVTEGFITGFTSPTTDQGTVAFCGRLARPEITAQNILQPMPDGSCTPPAPTISVLGRTINGRHISHWLTDEMRALFYPEVVNTGYSRTDPRLAIGSTLYAKGDLRLDCFLAGYRWDPITRTETLPDCKGFAYPTKYKPLSWTVADGFNNAVYSGNFGDVNWATSWAESGDDGSPTTGKISIPGKGGFLSIGTDGAAGRSIIRTADLRVSGSQLAAAATLNVTVDGSALSATAGVALEMSPDGVTWTTVETFTKANSPTGAKFKYSVAPYISPTTMVRLRATSTSASSGALLVDTISITYWDSASRFAPVFQSGMARDTRWGVIPKIGYWAGPSTAKPINGFWAAYAYTSYTTSTKLQAFDAWVFDPALTLADPANDLFQAGLNASQSVRLIR